MVMPNVYPALALAPQTANYLASDAPMRAYYAGREERLDDERRNYLREAGGMAAQGNISGAVGAAFRGGDPTTAINISNWDTDRRRQAITMLREGAQRADTPERWSALVNSVERVFGPEMVGNYRDFNSRPAALTALEQAQLQLAQSEAALKAQQAAIAERQARMDEYLFGQFGFGSPSGAAAPSASAPQAAGFPLPSTMPPMARPTAVPGVSVLPSPMAPTPEAPAGGERPIPDDLLPPLPVPQPETAPAPQRWHVPRFPNIGGAIRDAVFPPASAQTPAPAPAAPAPAPQAPSVPAAPAAPSRVLSDIAPGAMPAPPAPQQSPQAGQPQTLAGMVAAMSPANRNAAMLLLMKRDYAGLAKMIEGITPGTEAADREFAKEYANWNATGGYADVQRQLVQLARAANTLETGSNITGPVVGSLPDWINRFINSEAVANRQRVSEVVQRSLRQVLGAQFTEREGEMLVARAYDPTLPQSENLNRVRLLLGQIAAAAEAKQSASEFFRQNGTLRGWQGRQYTPADFDALLAPPQGGPQGSGQGSGQSGSGGLPTLTPDQARQLPPGTQFRGTDGNVYRVPLQTQLPTLTGR